MNRFDDTEEYLRGLRDLDAQEAQEAFEQDRLERLADYGPPVKGWPLRALDETPKTHTPPPLRGLVERPINARVGLDSDSTVGPVDSCACGGCSAPAGPPYGDAA